MQVEKSSRLFIEKGAKDKNNLIVIKDKGLGPGGDPINPHFTGSTHSKYLFISYWKYQTIGFLLSHHEGFTQFQP